LSREQFIWGVSIGVNVLAVAAAFWIGLAAWVLGTLRPCCLPALDRPMRVSFHFYTRIQQAYAGYATP
jgi:hypothetical protein